jgi:hypothetical protein
MRKLLTLLFFLPSCIGAGDMFAKREKIIGNYYLVETENGAKSHGIGYKVSGGYEMRSPESVVAYAVKDSMLVVKVKPFNADTFYYAINTNKGEMARIREYQMDSLATKDFQNSWLASLKLDFKEVK